MHLHAIVYGRHESPTRRSILTFMFLIKVLFVATYSLAFTCTVQNSFPREMDMNMDSNDISRQEDTFRNHRTELDMLQDSPVARVRPERFGRARTYFPGHPSMEPDSLAARVGPIMF